MSGRVKWDETGKKTWYTGIDRVVLYPIANDGTYPEGVGWNGVTGITESPSGAEETALWANNGKYGSLYSAEEFGINIAAYDSPEEFDECDGSKEIDDLPGAYILLQDRRTFGLTWRVLKGNDIQKQKYGYEIHVMWGGTASPSEREHSTTNASPEAENPSWEAKTIPVPVANVPGVSSTAHMKFDSTILTAAQLKALEDILYGVDADATNGISAAAAHLPSPDDLIAALKAAVSTTPSQDSGSGSSTPAATPTYTEFTGDSFESDVTYYERSGEEGSYTYTETADETPQQGTTYYYIAST